MNVSCGIIQDLLPLYHDQACSAESEELVRAHLAECAACREMLAELKREPERPLTTADETKPLRAARAAWSRGKKKSFWKGIALAALICAVLVGVLVGLTQWRGIPVDVDLLEVSEISRLADGRIAFRLRVKDNKNLRFIKFTVTDTGEFYMTPMRAVLEGNRPVDIGNYDEIMLANFFYDGTWQVLNHKGTEITACYVGPIGGGIPVWEKDAKLPPANAEIEQMFDYFHE